MRRCYFDPGASGAMFVRVSVSVVVVMVIVVVLVIALIGCVTIGMRCCCFRVDLLDLL